MQDKSDICIQEIIIVGKNGKWITSRSDDTVREVISRIHVIANLARESHNESADNITRIITDEYSFYPPQTAFSIDEYKVIIDSVADIADRLPPNIHLILATFPVIDPNGESIHNCGLYIQSPLKEGKQSTLHHFSKTKFPPSEPPYTKPTSGLYAIPEIPLSPSELRGSRVSLNDINQHGSAIKLTTSNNKQFFVTIGICKEHQEGVEREQLHGLIEQLKQEGEETPLTCSHVITSNSISAKDCCVLSTLSHADSREANRRKCFDRMMPSPTDLSPELMSLNAEYYPMRAIGTVHSDLFLHIVSDHTAEEISSLLNKPQRETGNTPLHRSILSDDAIDLVARRLYIMILHGADPDIFNAEGHSVRMIAETKGEPLIMRAISTALEWRDEFIKVNSVDLLDGKTALTKERSKATPSNVLLNELILKGANPYLKDQQLDSAWDMLAHQDKLRNLMINATFVSQYGYYDSSDYRLADKGWDDFRMVGQFKDYRFIPRDRHQFETLKLLAKDPHLATLFKIESQLKVYFAAFNDNTHEEEDVTLICSDIKKIEVSSPLLARLTRETIAKQLQQHHILCGVSPTTDDIQGIMIQALGHTARITICPIVELSSDDACTDTQKSLRIAPSLGFFAPTPAVEKDCETNVQSTPPTSLS